MKESIFEILNNTEIADNVYRLDLKGDVSEIARPGQFINIALEGFFLRRPISVSNVYRGGFDNAGPESGLGVVTVLYKVAGKGTEYLSGLKDGKLNVLTGLGNGFDISKAGSRPLLIGGGIGSAPMHMLAAELIKKGAAPTAVLGFRGSREVILEAELDKLGVRTVIATMDGSRGIKGTAADALKGIDHTYFYACGPMPMLNSIRKVLEGDGEYSFEERMGCGFGACVGCSMETKNGVKRVCKDGPVFSGKEIIWKD